MTDFGAKGNGVSDDTPAFRAALRTKAAIIKIPGGVWMIEDTRLDHRCIAVADDL